MSWMSDRAIVYVCVYSTHILSQEREESIDVFQLVGREKKLDQR